MTGIRRTVGITAASLGLATAGALALSPAATASPTSGTEYFTIVAQSSAPGTVIATGFFDASGSDTQRNSSDVLRFGNGKLVVAHPQSGVTSETFNFNPKTCAFSFKQSGTYTLKNGTGAYAGLTGSGTYHATGNGLAPRDSNGNCDLNSEPEAQTTVVHAHGPVSEGASS